LNQKNELRHGFELGERERDPQMNLEPTQLMGLDKVCDRDWKWLLHPDQE